MVKLTIRDILTATGGTLASGKGTDTVPAFSTDTRNIIPASVFIAINGKSFDGHDYVKDALDKGASGAIVERVVDTGAANKDKDVIVVSDTQEAMGKIAAMIRSRVHIPVISITGTNGKTTTKEILAHILSSKYNVLKSKKSFNNIIGLSLTLFELEASHEVAVLEIGTNHPGEIAKLGAIACPDIVVITNIGDGHLEFFGDRKGVYKEKTSLLDHVGPSGAVFLNKDDELLAGSTHASAAGRFFGRAEGADISITKVSGTPRGYGFLLNGDSYFIPLDGEHNVYNAAAAVAVARYMGLSPEEIRDSLAKVSLPEMRLEKVKAGDVTFINDSYNANPSSFECALKVLAGEAFAAKRGVVAGDMMELGDRTEEFHKSIGKSIAEKGIDFLIAIGPNAGHMVSGAVGGGMPSARAMTAATHQAAAQLVRGLAGAGTIVLLKGSRSARMEEVLKCFTTFYTR
jgi:UDP-N-acetylmuramoyl-tripeptide--D-alanyl-D-alanine ligase